MREQLSRTSWQGDGAGLVNEWHLFLNPVIVGGGKRALPDDVHCQLKLLAEHFENGVVHLRYGLSGVPA
jgi:hypothetical protein